MIDKKKADLKGEDDSPSAAPGSTYSTVEEVLKDIAKHFYDGCDGIEWCWQEGTSLESRGDDKLAKALRPYLEDM